MSTGIEEDLDAEEMSREELEERVEALEDVASVSAMLVNKLRGAGPEERVTWDDPEFLPIAGQTFSDLAETINSHDDTLKRVESTVQESRAATGSTDDEHWWNVVEAAHKLQDDQKHSLPNNWVKLFKENIAQATGLSKKRGQQLIDEWTEDGPKTKKGTKKQAYKPATASRKNSSRKKAIRIDLDVWEVDE